MMEDQSDNVSSDATYNISPSSDLSIIDPEMWLDSMSYSKSRKSSTSGPLTSVRPSTEDAELLTPVGSGKRSRVSVNKCHVCRKEFKTSSALKTHLLIHRHDGPHICSVCQKAFKQYHQLTSHMMTQHKKKMYHCTLAGCPKTYSDKNSLKHHCASRHGVHLTSPSSTSFTYKHDLLASTGEPSVNRAPLDSRGLVISQPKPVSTPVLKDPSYSGKLKLELGCYAEDTHPAKVKRLAHQESWTLATAGESYKVQESPKMVNSTQWTLGLDVVEENPVAAKSRFDVRGLDTNLDVPQYHPEGWKEMLSFQSNKEATTCSVGSPTRPPASVGPKKHCPILLKHSLKDPKPLNKLKRRNTFSSFTQPVLLCPEPTKDFDSNLPDPVLPSPPPHASLANIRKRKSCSQDSRDILSNVPAPPLPAPQPSCHKRSRSRSSYLVSPSQVALASFSTYLGNPFSEKESIMKSTGEEPSSDCRTHKRASSVRRVRSQPSCSQEALASDGTREKHNSQPATSTLDEGQKENSEQKQKSKGTNLSPLIMPVSVPVSVANILDFQASTHEAERLQTRKGASKRSHCLDPLKRLIIPSPPLPLLSSPQWARDQETQGLQRSRATGGYPSQLRSPTYLADHPLSPRFHPPPYTPQPMLSPLRPGTGLYFKNLPQYQPCPPLPSTLDGVSLPIDNTVVNIQPRINVGSRFQAEIPPVRDPLYILYEEHPAQLVWTPWKDLSTNTETQQRVTELIDMCCSSVLPGGGTNIELTLHCLHEVQGNITAALDLLLMRGYYRTSWHPLSDYHYTGSDHWTAQEMKVFKKALADHDKDFQLIQNVLQTKSIAQCVEYYYNMKKLKKLNQRGRAANKKDGCGENANMFYCFQVHQQEQTDRNTRQKTTAAESKVCARLETLHPTALIRDVKSHRSP
ncbi:zinc finger protein 541 isoform X2 [Pseudorasbora parva]